MSSSEKKSTEEIRILIADEVATLPSEWQFAWQRDTVIRPLAEADRLSCLQVDWGGQDSWSRAVATIAK